MFKALLAALAASLCLAATPGPVPLGTLQLNGDATMLADGFIRLTRNSNQASSAFVPTPFTLGPKDGFTAFFVYRSQQELDQCVADGLAFVAQNTAAGPSYLGEAGSGLGFFTGTVSPAMAVTFDYYQNALTGTPPNTAAIALPQGIDVVWTNPVLPVLSGPDEVRYVWVHYQNLTKTMKVFYGAGPQAPSVPMLETTLPVDLSTLFGGQVYFGVTGGTGSCYSQQFLLYMAVKVVHR